MPALSKTLLRTLVAAYLLIGSVGFAQSTLVTWATFPGLGERDFILGEVPGGVINADSITPLAMTRGGGLLPNAGNNSFNSNGWATNVDGDSTVLNTGGFVEIGFTVEDGFVATLDELLLGSRSSTSGPSEVGIFTSVDNFTSPIGTIQEEGEFSNTRLDLSSIGDVTGEFAIRFFNVGGVSPAAPTAGEFDMDEDSTWRIVTLFENGFVDNSPGITGSVTAVPEPGTVGVLTIGGVVALIRRRRRV